MVACSYKSRNVSAIQATTAMVTIKRQVEKVKMTEIVIKDDNLGSVLRVNWSVANGIFYVDKMKKSDNN